MATLRIVDEEEQIKAGDALKAAVSAACEPMRKSAPGGGLNFRGAIAERIRGALRLWWQDPQTEVRVELEWRARYFEVIAQVIWPPQHFLNESRVLSLKQIDELPPESKPDVTAWPGHKIGVAFRINGLRYPKEWSHHFEPISVNGDLPILPESEPRDIEWREDMSNAQFAERLRDKRRLAEWTR